MSYGGPIHDSFRFANGGDEMAMNAEIGLYLQFDVDNGIPKNCPGLQKFTLKKYLKSISVFAIDSLTVTHFNQIRKTPPE